MIKSACAPNTCDILVVIVFFSYLQLSLLFIKPIWVSSLYLERKKTLRLWLTLKEQYTSLKAALKYWGQYLQFIKKETSKGIELCKIFDLCLGECVPNASLPNWRVAAMFQCICTHIVMLALLVSWIFNFFCCCLHQAISNEPRLPKLILHLF